MSIAYPLDLQREVNRRWLQRSEEILRGRAHLNGSSHFLRQAAVVPKKCNVAGPPVGASSSKCSTAVPAM
jgi:hypothetical protein